jgi:filamentous hemagglutinin family protein
MKRSILFILLIISLSIKAQITTDGTLGPALNLQGTNYQISPNLGQQKGGNLFHSFQDFNLNSAESATFFGPNHIQNVISRVTGGNPSNIDGLIRSTIQGADIYFLNPYGIMFGPNARLDVQGSFHASTADYLRLEDGGRFDARYPNDSLLTVAPIEAFGFLTNSPAPLSIEGSQLTVPTEKTLSIISGHLTLNQAQLIAPFGRINLASVAEIGDVIPKYEDFVVPALRGHITVQNSQISTSDEGGGTIYIRGGQFELINSVVESDTLGSQNGGVIDIRVTNLELGGKDTRSKISAQTMETGQGGSIEIKAHQIALNDGAVITGDTRGSGIGGNISIQVAGTLSIKGQFPSSGAPSSISTSTANQASEAGNAGHLNIEAEQIVLTDGGAIRNITIGSGNGGDIILSADTLTVFGGFKVARPNILGQPVPEDLQWLPSDITVSSFGSGKAGIINLTARQIILEDGGQITGSTWHQGEGGSIKIEASDALIATGEYQGNITFHSGIMSNSNSQPTQASNSENIEIKAGNGGSITIEAGRIELKNGADINSETETSGIGGNISITVDETLSISGQAQKGSPSSISVSTVTQGNAGHLEIKAEQIKLTDGGAIQNITMGQGNAGDITILVTDTLTISGGFQQEQTIMFGESEISDERLGRLPSGIMAYSFGPGKASSIDLEARQIRLQDGGQITGSTWHQGEGGSINIKAFDTLMATGEYQGKIAFHSGIMSNSNSQQADAGDGGTIKIEADQIVLNDGADINSETEGSGKGGNIFITVDETLSLSGQAASSGSPSSISVSTASTEANAGNAGHLEIKAEQIKLTDGGAIQNITMGQGNGGDITLIIGDQLTISGGFQQEQTRMFGEIEITDERFKLLPSGIAAFSNGTGQSGTINVTARQIILQNGGGIDSSTSKQGEGGAINIKATDSLIAKGKYIGKMTFPSGILSNSTSEEYNAGNAGHIKVQANTVNLSNEGRISSMANNAGGGEITITVPNILYLRQGKIMTDVKTGKGDGGNITITNPLFVVLNNGQIVARADEGHGGNINIISNQLMSSQESQIDASSDKGIDGVVFVSAPETDISGQLLVLSTNFVNAADQMHSPCNAQVAEKLSHFVVVPREGTATQPDDLLPSGPLFQKPKPTKTTQKNKSTTATRSPQFALLFECRSKTKEEFTENSFIPEQLF